MADRVQISRVGGWPPGILWKSADLRESVARWRDGRGRGAGVKWGQWDDVFDIDIEVRHGAHKEPSGQIWVSRHGRFGIVVRAPESDPGATLNGRSLEVRLSTGPVGLYRRFPFNCHVALGRNGATARILEFTAPSQERRLRLPIPPDGRLEFAVTSELSAVPAQIGLGPDQRDLAVMMACSVVDLPPDTADLAGEPQQGWLSTANPIPASTPRPVFVVGMYRSGTSVLTWAIGQHPNIWPMEETGFFQILVNGILAAWQRGAEASRSFGEVYEIRPEQFAQHFGVAIDSFMIAASKERAKQVMLARLSQRADDFVEQIQVLRSVASPKRRWVDGTPENAWSVAQLHQIFPAARFIHIVRNPLSVAASMAHFDRMGGRPEDSETTLRLWSERVGMAHLAERALGSEIVMRVRYEDLIVQPAEVLSRIYAFLGEPDFGVSAETFTVRMNSSNVRSEEVAAVSATISPDRLAEALSLYEAASRPLSAPLAPDPAAAAELAEIVGDQIRSLQTLYA